MRTRSRGRRREGSGGAWLAAAVLVVGGAAAAGAQEAPGLLDRPARLEVHDSGLEETLRALQRSSGVALAFSPDLLPSDVRVTCPCSRETVRSALDRILTGTDLVYRAGRRQVLIGQRGTGAGEAASAPAVHGVVVDRESGRPVTAAEVRPSDGSVAVLTDEGGRFQLPAGGGEARELSVTSLGHEPRTVRVAPGAGPVRVELESRPIPLERIVISPGRFGVLEASPGLSGSVLSRADIEAIPQFGDDAFRTLMRLPGVAAEDISTRLNVRGGTARDLLVRLDGLELFEPYHLKDVDGAFGIVDVQALGGIDLVTGGFPAEYGDKTAGVMEMSTREPPARGTRTTLGLSMSSVSAISQGSFAEGRGQWLGSLRRGFLQYVLAVTGVDDDLKPTYWDALGKVQLLVGGKHLVWGELLYGGDAMRWFDESTSSTVTSRWGNGYLWGGWKADWSARLRSETVVSAGRLTRDRTGWVEHAGGGAFTPLEASVADLAGFDFVGVRQDWQLDLTGDLLVKAGLDLRATTGEYDYRSASSRWELDAANHLFVRVDGDTVEVAPRGVELGSWVALRGRAGERLTWEAGLRHDGHGHTGDRDLSPRLLARLDLDDRTALRGSWGRYFQSQGIHELDVQDGERTFWSSERADQAAVGLERVLGGGLSARLEAYHRRIADPLPTYVNLAREVNPIMEVQGDRHRVDATEARARGIELILARDGVGPATWSASYALARAEDRVDGRWAPRVRDQVHTLNLRGAYRIGGAWQLSGVWTYHTGWPYTAQILDLEVAYPGEGEDEEVHVIRRGFGPLNAERLPAYHRLDVRITRAFVLGGGRLEVYLDAFNAYNRTNLRGYHWGLRGSDGRFSAVRTDGEEQMPILPTIGFRWVF